MNMTRKSKVSIAWNHNFAYCIGLIATDGSLSKDGRHICFTSKDYDLVQKFAYCLSLKNKIGVKLRGQQPRNSCYVVQFGDKSLYEFLVGLGLGCGKSKTLGALNIPDEYFADFLRGCLDGDGSITVTSHPQSQYPQLRVRLYAYNPPFLNWVYSKIKELTQVSGGWIYTDKIRTISALSFGKSDSVVLLRYIYEGRQDSVCLSRKRNIAVQFLA